MTTRGSSVIDHIRATLQGGGIVDPKSWVDFGFMDYLGASCFSKAHVPAGKKFKLWALGLGDGATANLDIRAYDATRGQPIHALGLGVYFASYLTPYTADGPCVVNLQGYNNLAVGAAYFAGLMVFSIE